MMSSHTAQIDSAGAPTGAETGAATKLTVIVQSSIIGAVVYTLPLNDPPQPLAPANL